MTPNRYTNTAVALHWLHAGLIIFLLGWGWYMVELPKGPERGFPFSLHKSLGMTAFLLVIVRASWRVFHPPVPIASPTYMDAIAKKVHLFFYVLLFLTPAMGFMSASFTTHKMKFFGLEIPRAGWPDPVINDFFSQLHQWFGWCIILFIITHVGGALFHSLKDHDVLKRMKLRRFGE